MQVKITNKTQWLNAANGGIVIRRIDTNMNNLELVAAEKVVVDLMQKTLSCTQQELNIENGSIFHPEHPNMAAAMPIAPSMVEGRFSFVYQRAAFDPADKNFSLKGIHRTKLRYDHDTCSLIEDLADGATAHYFIKGRPLSKHARMVKAGQHVRVGERITVDSDTCTGDFIAQLFPHRGSDACNYCVASVVPQASGADCLAMPNCTGADRQIVFVRPTGNNPPESVTIRTLAMREA